MGHDHMINGVGPGLTAVRLQSRAESGNQDQFSVEISSHEFPEFWDQGSKKCVKMDSCL